MTRQGISLLICSGLRFSLEYSFQMRGDADIVYLGDARKLRKALMNILENAVKFTPAPGKVSFTAEQAATFENHSTLRFIAVSANAFEEDIQRSMQAGMNARLSKPVEPERLYDTLERMIFSKR